MIEVTWRQDIAVLTMTHGKANALDIELCQHLAARFDELKSARAIVLTGQGKIFSAGVDLVRALNEGPGYFKRFLPLLRKAYETIFFHPRPVVAAVNGHAVAGGCVLACCADRRLMAREPGRTGITELLVGVPFPVIAFEVMRFVTAPHRFAEIVYSGATFVPEAAIERGLVDEVLDPADLLERALAAAQTLAALRPDAFALAKRQARQPVLDRLQADGPRFDAMVDDLWMAPECFERIKDYMSRTFKKA